MTIRSINKSNTIKHVAIIMDGNGRWALSKSLSVTSGHKKGVEVVREIVKESIEQEIKILTIYAFSSENWQRPTKEILGIKKLIIESVKKQLDELIKQKVRLNFFGNIDDFGKKVQKEIQIAEDKTCLPSPNLFLNIALGYGCKNDISQTVKHINNDVLKEKIQNNQIDMDLIFKYQQAPDEEVDLLIRTGGNKRLSNFLLLNLAYAEIYFIEKLWPAFTRNDFKKCIEEFKITERKFGKRIKK